MNLVMWLSKILNRISLIGKWRHLYRIKQSKKVLKKIKEISLSPKSGGKILLYLRKVNPYVFEEVVLTAIESSNIRVIRNLSYSGDGGVDGVFKINIGKVLVQSKRYKSYINGKHVQDFAEIIKNKNFRCGVFVHTGKTGTNSKDIIKIEGNIIVISGDNLIKILLNEINIEEYINKKLKV